MRNALTSAVAMAVMTLQAGAQEQSKALFNGKDLAGWTVVFDREGPDPAATWSVADGVLKTTGTPVGYIKTDAEYRDYVLTLDWRWPAGASGGNSGVLVHCSTPRALGVWPKSIEVQLAQDNAGDFWVIGTELDVPDEASRKTDRRHKNLTDGSEKPAGEWNRMEVTCRGDVVRVKVNDDLVNEATNCSVKEGAIALQAEGKPVEFRDIRIAPLAK